MTIGNTSAITWEALSSSKASPWRYPKGHAFPLALVHLALLVRFASGAGLRGCCRIIGLLIIYCRLNCKCPCPNTLNNWCRKMGAYFIARDSEAIAHHQKWVLFIDESMCMGTNSLLVVAAMPLEQAQQQGCKRICDLHLLLARAWAGCWKGENVLNVLQQLPLTKEKVAYVVADKGSNIQYALRRTGWAYVPDCSHAVASVLESLLKEDPGFKGLCRLLALWRRQWNSSKKAVYMPPQLRSKARFLNIRQISRWTGFVLRHKEELGRQQHFPARELEELENYRSLAFALERLSTIGDMMLGKLKEEGYHQGLHGLLLQALDGLKESGWEQSYAQKMKAYLQLLKSRLGDHPRLCCSSDVIESWFGKYKSCYGRHKLAPITDSVLCMACQGKAIEEWQVKEGLEQIKIKNIQSWKEENMVETLLKKRRAIFKKQNEK